MKNNLPTYGNLLILAAIVTLTFPDIAQGYLDPGSGSYILQILFGVLFGASYLVKVYWGKIKSFFGKSPAGDSFSDSKDD